MMMGYPQGGGIQYGGQMPPGAGQQPQPQPHPGMGMNMGMVAPQGPQKGRPFPPPNQGYSPSVFQGGPPSAAQTPPQRPPQGPPQGMMNPPSFNPHQPGVVYQQGLQARAGAAAAQAAAGAHMNPIPYAGRPGMPSGPGAAGPMSPPVFVPSNTPQGNLAPTPGAPVYQGMRRPQNISPGPGVGQTKLVSLVALLLAFVRW